MEKLFYPIDYIDRHLEPAPEPYELNWDQVDVQQDFNRPLGNIEYKDAGTVELGVDDVTVYYRYKPSEVVPEQHANDPGPLEGWREISHLTLQCRKDGYTIQLEDLYPEEYRTLFSVLSNQQKNTYHDASNRRVVIGTGLFTVAHFATLLHEVGHAVDRQAHPHLYSEISYMMQQYGRGNPVAQSQVLMKERNAWAFALAKLRPFLSNDPVSPFYIQSVQAFIHDACLKTYSDEIWRARMWFEQNKDA